MLVPLKVVIAHAGILVAAAGAEILGLATVAQSQITLDLGQVLLVSGNLVIVVMAFSVLKTNFTTLRRDVDELRKKDGAMSEVLAMLGRIDERLTAIEKWADARRNFHDEANRETERRLREALGDDTPAGSRRAL